MVRPGAVLLQGRRGNPSYRLQVSADVVMVSTGNKNDLVRFGKKNHSQMKTGATLHNGSAKFSDSCAPV